MKKTLFVALMMLAGIAHSAEWLNTEVNVYDGGSMTVYAVDISSVGVDKGNIRTAWTKNILKIDNSEFVAFSYITINCEKQMWRATWGESYMNGVVRDKPGPVAGPWNFFDFAKKNDSNKFRAICK